MMRVGGKREQEGLSGSLFRFKSWHVASHTRFSKDTLTRSHTHTHTLTWLISSAFTGSAFHGTIPLKAKGVEAQGYYTRCHTHSPSFSWLVHCFFKLWKQWVNTMGSKQAPFQSWTNPKMTTALATVYPCEKYTYTCVDNVVESAIGWSKFVFRNQ